MTEIATDYLSELAGRQAARAPASIGEIWSAEWARSGLDTIGGIGRPLAAATDEFATAIEKAGGSDLATMAAEKNIALGAATTVDRHIALLNALADTLPEEQRKPLDKLRDVRARAVDKAQAIERDASDVAAGTYGLSGTATMFLAGLARQAVDPANLVANIATGPLGGPFAGPALRVIGRQTIAGIVGQAAVEPYIVSARQELGLETHALEDIGQAAIASGGLPALFKAGAWSYRLARRGLTGELKLPGRPEVPKPAENLTPESRTGTAPSLPDMTPEDFDAAAALLERNRLFEAAAGKRELDRVNGAEASVALEHGRPNELAPIAATLGEPVDIIRPNGGRLSVRPGIVELDDLVISHDLAGAPNAQYPAELQPRDRSAPASRTWVAEKAKSLEPELLGEAPTAGLGAPVIGRDGVVESGNGRALLLARAYEAHPERVADYQKFLEANGYDLTGFRKPVLVRVREGELSLAARAAFAQEANVSATAGMSTRERAFADAKFLDENLLAGWRGGSVASAENAQFVRTFADRAIAAEERPQFIGADDRLSAEGARRLEAALVAKAWGAQDIVASLYESPDPTSKAILGAFADTAPQVARLAVAIAEKRVPADANPVPALLDAFRLVERARAGNLRVADLVNQVDLERGAVPEATREAVRLFFRDDNLRLAAGRESVTARIGKAVDRALGEANALGDLFGVKPSASNALRAGQLAGAELADQPLFTGAAPGLVERAAIDPAVFAQQRALLTAQQPFKTIDEAIARAPARQAELVAALEEIGGKDNVKNPGVKTNRARMEQKVADKYRGDPKQLADLARAGVVVDTPQAADELARGLAQRYRVIDEGWNVSPAGGYFDRKLEVVMPDGTMAEVQLWPPEVYAAKKGRGTELYNSWRAAPEAERPAWEQKHADYWSEVMRQVDAAWRDVIGGSPNASKSSANAVRAISSESGLASVSERTSAELTGRQPSLPIEKARPSETTAATVVPQENQRVSEAITPSTTNVSPAAAAGKLEISPSRLRQRQTEVGGPLPDEGTKEISVDGRVVASMRFVRGNDGVLIIQNIETLSEHRRQGYASALVKDLMQEFPNDEIRTNLRSEAGQKFFGATFGIKQNEPLRGAPAAATDKPEIIRGSDFTFVTAGTRVTAGPKEIDLGAVGDEIARRVETALNNGASVVYHVEDRAVPIVRIDRGMMADAQGQRWGVMALLSPAPGKRTEIEIIPRAAERPAASDAVRARIEQAYLALTGGSKGESVPLSKLRAELSDLDRATVDAGLLRILQGDETARLGQISDPKAISAQEKAASFSPGGEPFHLLHINESAPRARPRAPAPAEKPLGDPVLAREAARVLDEFGGDVTITLEDGTKVSVRAGLEEARADARAAAELEDCIGQAAAEAA